VTLPRQLDPAFASTDDIMAAASITRSTVKTWENMGLLPAPLKISLGMGGGVFNRYPAWAVERARFIAEKRAAGFTYDEVRAMLAKMEAQETRKPKARPEQAEPATTAVKRTKSTAKTARAGRGGRR
jgi:DNA-binding transcriptional MerR regulator